MNPTQTTVAALFALALWWSGCSAPTNWRSASVWASSGSPPVLTEQPESDLPEPQGLVATSGELREIPLKWEPVLVGEVGGYLIERSAERAGPFERLVTIAGRLNTQYIDRTTLHTSTPADAPSGGEMPLITPINHADGLTWFYRIRAFSPSGALGATPSTVVIATTAPPPGAPQELRAYSRQPRQVPLSWRASEDRLVQGYWIYRSPTASGPYQIIKQLDGRYQTTYVDSALGDLRVFYYRVAATNRAGGLGSPTPPVQAVTKPEPLPPLRLHATEQRLGSNLLSWEPNVEPDIVEYRVLRIRSQADMPEIVASVSSQRNVAEDRAVGAGEHISYSIIAIDQDGLESNPAEPVAVVSVGYGLEGRNVPDGIRLSWDVDNREPFRGSHVFRHGRFRRKDLGFTTENHFLDPEVQSGHRYRYSVVLERPDETLAPPSQVIEVSVPANRLGNGLDHSAQ